MHHRHRGRVATWLVLFSGVWEAIVGGWRPWVPPTIWVAGNKSFLGVHLMQILGGKTYGSNLSCFRDGGTDRSDEKIPVADASVFSGGNGNASCCGGRLV